MIAATHVPAANMLAALAPAAPNDSGMPFWWFAWVAVILLLLGFSIWTDRRRRSAIRGCALSLGLQALGAARPDYVPLAQANAGGRRRQTAACYAGVFRGSEVAIYDLSIGSGKHVRRHTVVGVRLAQPDSFRSPPTVKLLGFDYERDGAWVLVLLAATIQDANRIEDVLDYLTADA